MAEVTGNYAKEVKIYRLADRGEIPSEMIAKAEVLPLEFLARGDTCCCYRIGGGGSYAGWLLKEFRPRNSKRDENGAQINANSLGFKAFEAMGEPVERLVDSYDHAKATFFEDPVLYDTSLGKCYLYKKVAGEMVSNFMKERRLMWKERLCQVLRIMVFVLNDLQKLHEAGMVHLDMKMENTFVLFIDNEKDFRCRSIDLGSCMTLPPEKGWSKLTPGDFASTEGWYLGCDIEMITVFLQDYDGEDDEIKKNALRWLDLKACMKMMLGLLLKYDPKVTGKLEVAKALLKGFFCSQSIAQNEVIHYLDIFDRLLAIVDHFDCCPFVNKTDEFYPLSEFRLDLYRLLAILGDTTLTPDTKEEKEAVRKTELIHNNLSTYCTELLKNHEKSEEWSFSSLLNDYEVFINNPNTKPEEYSVAGYYKHLLIKHL